MMTNEDQPESGGKATKHSTRGLVAPKRMPTPFHDDDNNQEMTDNSHNNISDTSLEGGHRILTPPLRQPTPSLDDEGDAASSLQSTGALGSSLHSHSLSSRGSTLSTITASQMQMVGGQMVPHIPKRLPTPAPPEDGSPGDRAIRQIGGLIPPRRMPTPSCQDDMNESANENATIMTGSEYSWYTRSTYTSGIAGLPERHGTPFIQEGKEEDTDSEQDDEENSESDDPQDSEDGEESLNWTDHSEQREKETMEGVNGSSMSSFKTPLVIPKPIGKRQQDPQDHTPTLHQATREEVAASLHMERMISMNQQPQMLPQSDQGEVYCHQPPTILPDRHQPSPMIPEGNEAMGEEGHVQGHQAAWNPNIHPNPFLQAPMMPVWIPEGGPNHVIMKGNEDNRYRAHEDEPDNWSCNRSLGSGRVISPVPQGHSCDSSNGKANYGTTRVEALADDYEGGNPRKMGSQVAPPYSRSLSNCSDPYLPNYQQPYTRTLSNCSVQNPGSVQGVAGNSLRMSAGQQQQESRANRRYSRQRRLQEKRAGSTHSRSKGDTLPRKPRSTSDILKLQEELTEARYLKEQALNRNPNFTWNTDSQAAGRRSNAPNPFLTGTNSGFPADPVPGAPGSVPGSIQFDPSAQSESSHSPSPDDLFQSAPAGHNKSVTELLEEKLAAAIASLAVQQDEDYQRQVSNMSHFHRTLSGNSIPLRNRHKLCGLRQPVPLAIRKNIIDGSSKRTASTVSGSCYYNNVGGASSVAAASECSRMEISFSQPPTPWKCVCGLEHEEEYRFCGFCGTAKYWTCTSCHFERNKCQFSHCGGCGIRRVLPNSNRSENKGAIGA